MNNVMNVNPSQPSKKTGIWLGMPPPIEYQQQYIFIDNMNELLNVDLNNAYFVIAAAPAEQDELLLYLRKQYTTGLCLIFVTAASRMSPYLANGLFGEDVDKHVDKYLHKKSLVNLYYEKNHEFTLLTYLWLHPDFELTPMKDPQGASLFYYPIFEAWGISNVDSFALLAQLQAKGWLESTRLISRVRFSPCCHSSHLNYIDVCPRCFDLDINIMASLHCFNCGHIGEQSAFRDAGVLACPNCFTQLRHIGVDYDRPIETHSCRCCHHMFVDANVQAQCLECDEKHALDELVVRNIHTYRLAQSGRLLVIQGAMTQIFSEISGNVMDSNQFYWVIKWQNELARRHHHRHAIIAIKVLNLDEIVSSELSFLQLQEFQERLSSIVRTTDACSQFTEEGLLLFLPFVNSNQLQSVYKKLTELTSSLSQEFQFQFNHVELPSEIGIDVKSWLVDNFVGLE
ncbi:hypothetical protein [Shewanella sp. NIFS-20-20]|uniref:TackOD1 domain-containing metal-binding protein n=1 Tax=Shewanella sp. NIFS-20-20 TaxID=2853806 RepID=UPI001C45F938|nr:hypothetical protein [Shewanella sp. NIFS-20-20]MBV7315123.1 hypothetical protein [Shewanella sp. NIFS-20-20]